ncbi:MAG: Thiamine biosynthesis lipoprotein ApbE precursor [Verrucomicrobiota bacterium]
MNAPRFQHEAMATFWELTLPGAEPAYARQAAQAAFRELDRLEGELSRFIEHSVISRANRLPPGGDLTLTPDVLACLLVAAEVSVATGRAFDPAFRSSRPPNLPPELPPYFLDPETHRLTSRAERLDLDLGAVGKGYALDCLADLLREWGFPAAHLNAGGSSVLAFGDEATAGDGWTAGLVDGEGHRIPVTLRDASLSGSGTEEQGGHLMDPRNGRTAEARPRAWALAPSAAQADALSTAFFVLEEARIREVCAAHPGIGAAWLAADGTLQGAGTLAGAANADPRTQA